MESGIRIFDHFREADLIPDAFVCANDNIAVGLATRARETGFRIPDDLAVRARPPALTITIKLLILIRALLPLVLKKKSLS